MFNFQGLLKKKKNYLRLVFYKKLPKKKKNN